MVLSRVERQPSFRHTNTASGARGRGATPLAVSAACAERSQTGAGKWDHILAEQHLPSRRGHAHVSQSSASVAPDASAQDDARCDDTRCDGRGHDMSRRAVLAAGTGVASSAIASSAFAQDQWWERVLNPDRGTRARVERTAQKRSKASPPDDLRPGNIPWRSDEMLNAMDRAIERYQANVRDGRWPTIPRGRLLRAGAYDERVPLIRRRLALTGELPERGYRGQSGSVEYDRWIEDAVRTFQKNHGLRVTGMLNNSTRAQLNVTPKDRLQQLKVNRTRIERLLQGRIGERYVLVNAAAYQLEAVERYEVERRHRVIVGKPDRQTPEIEATIKGLNFFPYWRVPQSIAVRDIIPRLLKEPGYLEQEHIRVVEGHYNGPIVNPTSVDWRQADPERLKFRQDPGPWNALGLVRINMPNPEIVYLHDTPMKPLFDSQMRAFSAGCVRVQDVMQLAAWLLRYERDYQNADHAIHGILEAGEPVDIELERPVPVYFTYITAWAEMDGSIEFRPDIYGRDGSDALRGERDPDDPVLSVSLSP